MSNVTPYAPPGFQGPPVSAPRRSGRGSSRLVLAGALVVLLGLLTGAGLLLYGFGSLVQLAPPEPIAGTAQLEGQRDQEYVISSTGEATAEGCRVTTATGTAVPIRRSPQSSRTLDDVTYRALSLFTAPADVRLEVTCPADGLFVAPRGQIGRNVLAIVGAFVVGGGLFMVGLALIILGLVLGAGRGRPAQPVRPPGRPGPMPPPRWPPAGRS